jgi:hypothetical protein
MVTDGVVIVALLAGVAVAVNKTVSVVKAIVNRDPNGYVTPLIVWAVAIAAVILMAHASLTMNGTIPALGVQFGSLDWASQVLFGWVLGGGAAFSFDITAAIDNTDSASELPLLPRRSKRPR